MISFLAQMTKYIACAWTAAFVATRIQASMMRREITEEQKEHWVLPPSPAHDPEFGERCQTVEFPTPVSDDLEPPAPGPNITPGAGGEGEGELGIEGILSKAVENLLVEHAVLKEENEMLKKKARELGIGEGWDVITDGNDVAECTEAHVKKCIFCNSVEDKHNDELVKCEKCNCWFHGHCDRGSLVVWYSWSEVKCTFCAEPFTLRCGCEVKRNSKEYDAHMHCIECGVLICPKETQRVLDGLCCECGFHLKRIIAHGAHRDDSMYQ
jgi:hypothetical protein